MFIANVFNAEKDTEFLKDNPYVVVTVDGGCLWYYGAYPTQERANEVVRDLGGNRLVVKYAETD